MSRHSHRQNHLSNAEKKEHKHMIEFVILITADMVVRLMVEPDHVKHSFSAIFSAIFGQ